MTAGADKRFKRIRFWGRMEETGMPERVTTLVFVASAIAAMSFTQLGFWPLCVLDDKPVYLLLMLAPLLMGALVFGPVLGGILGLFAGAVVFAHATFFPLDFYELYYMTPLNTFGLFTLMGAVGGWLFSAIHRRFKLESGIRVLMIIVACVVLSFAASGVIVLNLLIGYGGVTELDFLSEFLFNSPRGVALQALVDAVLIALLCLVADRILIHYAAVGNDRSLHSIFRNWMLLVSAIVFILASALVYSSVTRSAEDVESKEMISEVQFLQHHIAAEGDSVNYDSLIGGYDVAMDGWIVITDRDANVIASDDRSRFPEGSSFLEVIGYKSANEDASEFLDSIIDSEAEGGVVKIQEANEDGSQSLDVVFMAAGECPNGYAIVMRTPEMVYANRFGVMASLALLAVLLIAAVGILATALLRRVVVSRINETNESLDKITDGNLRERVKVYDSREFTSLSRGINSTVSALRDTINEVQKKNAQELLTAKAIQESSLPREFPPFPEIDKFDLYASMKTAKEVGGDFYDFFLIGEEEEKLGFVMADVSGKGIPAALFMMAAKTQIENYLTSDLELGQAVDAVNHQLCIGNDAGMFVTAWIAVLDYSTGSLSYVNAGHNPPLILRGESWEWIREVSGMPLGLFDGIPYDQYQLQLQPEDMLYLYTDGVTEAMNAEGELFDEDRLEKTLYLCKDMNPRSVGVGVRRALTDFTLDCEQSDDITMLILKYGVPPEKRAVVILDADDKQLVHVFNFIHEELARHNAPKSVYNPLDIAAEELFVNVCHYAYPDATPENPGEVRIGFVYDAHPPSLTVSISDDGIPYNPLAKPDAVTPDDIMEVPIGGLGILMAKKSVDGMSYERVGDSNVVTFVKQW